MSRTLSVFSSRAATVSSRACSLLGISSVCLQAPWSFSWLMRNLLWQRCTSRLTLTVTASLAPLEIATT